MSWSTSGSSLDVDSIAALPEPTFQPEFEAEMREQFEAARAAAVAIVSSGAVGTGKLFSVSMGGHANAEHEPGAPYVNDYVSVSVNQMSPVES